MRYSTAILLRMEATQTIEPGKSRRREGLMAPTASTLTLRVTHAGRNEDTVVSRRAFTYEEAERMAAQRAAFIERITGARAEWRVLAA